MSTKIEKNVASEKVLKDLKGDVILLHGVFDERFFDEIYKRKPKHVFVMEGRPNLESLQNSCQELLKRKITPTVISDNMAGFLFAKKLVKEVCVAYFEKNSQQALCPVGALVLGILAKTHKIPLNVYPGQGKPRFQGMDKEVFYFNGLKVSPKGVEGYVPLSEWLEKKYINKIN